MNAFAKAIYEQKYAHDIDGRKETWEETANRVGRTVLKAVHASKDLQDDAVEIIRTKKFIPGGRYLASTGKQFHQTQNCLLLRAQDSREGWSDLYQKASMALMTGAGIGVDYSQIRGEGKPIRKTGGRATGPLALMSSLNSVGHAIRQGGDRRSAIWAGLSWQHPDIHKLITFKNWIPEVRALKEKDFDFPATMDGTNISVQLDDEFFAAFADEKNAKHSLAQSVYWGTVRQMLKTGEPGFSVDLGKNSKETLRNAPICGDTKVLTNRGYKKVGTLLDVPVTVWTGKQWVETKFVMTNHRAAVVRVRWNVWSDDGGQSTDFLDCDPTHPFLVRRSSGIERLEAQHLSAGHELEVSMPAGFAPFTASIIEVRGLPTLEPVYCCDVKVEEHSFCAEGIIISNCTEVTSADDSDICNLGSINLAQINSVAEFESVMNSAITFLLAGTVYSDVPYAKVDQIRTKNRRLGLGLMGIHEWLLVRGKKYGQDAELEEILKVYAQSTKAAREWADKWDLSHPVKTRAIAPTGTIGIIAETSTGIESLFCVAYKRRYAKGNLWAYQYVVDPTAKRLIDSGINPDLIEDAYTLAEEPERRVAFQAWTQQFVDHGISSTINLPAWGSEANNESKVQPFGEMLIKYLPKLRGITCYPDGGRSGQPLQPIKYATAIKHVGEVFEESIDLCDLTKGGSCGA